VNEEQKGKAYSIQSFLCNAGSLVGYLFPYFFTYIGVKNVAPEGVIPDSVIYSFYVGAAILILCVIYTTAKVHEWPPQEFAEYNDATLANAAEPLTPKKNGSVWNTFLTIGLVQFFCWAAFMYMWTYTPGAIADNCWGTTDPASAGYQEAANWVGVVFAVQAVGSVIWASVIPLFGTNYRTAYAISLLIGAAGFISCQYIHNQYVLFLPFLLIGCAWAAMLALPFTLFTNAIQGNPKMGTYLGLFNCTICLPQIVAAVLGGQLLKHVAGGSQPMMLFIAGVLLLLAALSVPTIKNSKA